jgi:peptidoglycan/LPS O-acetylase OafA/YrhL
VVFHVDRHPPGFIRHKPQILLYAGCLGLVALPLLGLPYTATLQRIALWRDLVAGSCFAMIALALAQRSPKLFVNIAFRHLGKISFSAYLVHFAILEGLRRTLGTWPDEGVGAIFWLLGMLALVFPLAGLLASLTYTLIERPMIDLGNRLIEILERPVRPTEMKKEMA